MHYDFNDDRRCTHCAYGRLTFIKDVTYLLIYKSNQHTYNNYKQFFFFRKISTSH